MGKLVPANNTLGFSDKEYRRLFGPGLFIITNLTNIRVGDTPRIRCAYRFVCRQGGFPASMHAHIMQSEQHTGYSKGDGGRIRIELREGSVTAPDLAGEPIAVANWIPNLVNLNGQTRGEFREFFWTDVKKLLTRGTAYWIVFSNTHADPVNNFVSVNTAGVFDQVGRSNRWLNTHDFAVFMDTNNSGNWINLTEQGSGPNRFSPQMQLTYSDGRIEGAFPMESGFAITPTIRMFDVEGPRKIRERFHMYGTRVFSGVSFAFACGSPGQIRWSIKEEGGQVLATGTLTENVSNYEGVNVGSRNTIGFVKWYDLELETDITFTHGKVYHVEFEAVSGKWYFGAFRNGSYVGARYPAAFTLSNTQNTTDGNTWRDHYVHNFTVGTYTDSNLPIVLHEAERSGAISPGNPDDYRFLDWRSDTTDYLTVQPAADFPDGAEPDRWGRPVLRKVSHLPDSSYILPVVRASEPTDPEAPEADMTLKSQGLLRQTQLRGTFFNFSPNQVYSPFEAGYLARVFEGHTKTASDFTVPGWSADIPNAENPGLNMSAARQAAAYIQDALINPAVSQVSFFNTGKAKLSFKDKFTNERGLSAFMLGLAVARISMATACIGHAQIGGFISNLYGMRAVLMSDGSQAYALVVNNDNVERSLSINLPNFAHGFDSLAVRTVEPWSLSAPRGYWQNSELEIQLQIVKTSSQCFVTRGGTVFGIVIPANSVVALKV